MLTDADLVVLMREIAGQMGVLRITRACLDAAAAIERLGMEVVEERAARRLALDEFREHRDELRRRADSAENELAQLQSLAAARADDDAHKNAVLMSERATLKAAHEQDMSEADMVATNLKDRVARAEASIDTLVVGIETALGLCGPDGGPQTHNQLLAELQRCFAAHEQDIEAAARRGWHAGVYDATNGDRLDGSDDVDGFIARFKASRAEQQKEQDHG